MRGMNGNEKAPLVDVRSMHGGKTTVIGVVLMTLLSFPGEIFSERDQYLDYSYTILCM